MPPRALRASRLAPVLLALFVPGIASAATAVVTPFVAKNIDAKVATNVTGLISSELDFSGAYDTVTELPQAPSTLNEKCLASTSCLQGIAKASSADAVLTGLVTPGGAGLQVQLVLYDATKNAIKSKQSFDVAADPSALANESGKWVKAVLSGTPPAAAAAAEAPPSFDGEEEDDFAFDSAKPASKPTTSGKSTGAAKTSDVPANTRMKPTVNARELEDEEEDFAFEEEEEPVREDPKAKAKAEAEAKAKAEAEARAKAEAAAKAKAEAEARAKAEAAAQAKAEAEARAKAEAAAKAKAEAERRAREQEEAEDRAREEARAKAEAARRAREAAEAASALEDEEEEEPVAPSRSSSSSASSKSGTSGKSAAKPPPSDDVDDFEFGSSAGLIAIESEEEEAPAPSFDDEDEDAPSARSRASSSASSSRTSTSSASKASSSSASRSPSSAGSSSRSAASRSYDEDEDEDLADLDALDDEDEDTLADLDADEEPRRSRSDDDEEEDRPSSRSRSSSFDEDERDSRSSSSRSTSSSSRSSSSSSRSSSSRFDELDGRSARIDDGGKPGVGLAARVGYSRYYDFNFVTYGGELNIPAGPVQVLVGVEGFSTQQEDPDEVRRIAEEEGIPPAEVEAPMTWRMILPINAGIVYKHTKNAVRPYGGVDLTVTFYTPELDPAFGARARAGADFMVSDVFGFNLNLSAGLMWGEQFESKINVANFGLIPQISGGTILQF